MFKLKKSKGYGLVEGICSLAILFICIPYFLSFGYRYKHIINYNKETKNALEFAEAVQNNIKYGYDYDEIYSLIANKFNKTGSSKEFQGTVFINRQNLNLDALNNKTLMEILEEEKVESPCLEINLHSLEDRIIIFNLNFLNYSQYNPRDLQFTFYKGDY